MKRTYLYPLGHDEVWLWRAARADASDLFGGPSLEASESMWLLDASVRDALSKVRDSFMKRLEGRDRICVGLHYVIPGSLCPVSQERAEEADEVVREVTELTWDAPILYGPHYAKVYSVLENAGGQNGRDDGYWIRSFLSTTRGERVIPVWM